MDADRLLDDLFSALAIRDGYGADWIVQTAAFAALSQSPDAVRAEAVTRIVERLVASSHVELLWPQEEEVMVGALLETQPPLDAGQVARTLDAVASSAHLAAPIAAFVLDGDLTEAEPEVQAALRAFYERTGWVPGKAMVQVRRRLQQRLALEAPPVRPVDAWTERLLALAAPDDYPAWRAWLAHCDSASSSKPSKRWLKQAAPLLEPFADDTLLSLYDAVGRKAERPVVRHMWEGNYGEADSTLVSDDYSQMLRGVVWCAALRPSKPILLSLGDLADRCFKKVRNVGPRAPKIGNAAVWVLGQAESVDAVGQLSRLETRVKHASSRRAVGKALAAAATRLGVSASDLADLAIPDGGLTEVGRRTERLEGYRADVVVEGSQVSLRWTTPAGKAQKSVPKPVKEAQPAKVKELRGSLKEIRGLLSAQSARLERTFVESRAWRFDSWRGQYVDHPLMGTLARRLVWTVDEELTVWRDGELRDLSGRAVAASDATVALWHPLDRDPETALVVRDHLMDLSITQPFKQAHREVYRVTEAERDATHCRRFAGHIVKQHQLAALCQQRGWRYQLQGGWDGGNVPTVEVGEWGAELDLDADYQGGGMTEAGVFLHVTTGRVGFRRAGEAVPIGEVPPRIVSELLRDVDLFVEVCSVGNDPHWLERHAAHRDYWLDYALGVLRASAETRRAVLEVVLPTLSIAEKAHVDGRFLVVAGSLHTYRIHLGSGQVVLAADDQLLTITPEQLRSKRTVDLPFEGDPILMQIVRKAFLLAEDRKIRDPDLQRQL